MCENCRTAYKLEAAPACAFTCAKATFRWTFHISFYVTVTVWKTSIKCFYTKDEICAMWNVCFLLSFALSITGVTNSGQFIYRRGTTKLHLTSAFSIPVSNTIIQNQFHSFCNLLLIIILEKNMAFFGFCFQKSYICVLCWWRAKLSSWGRMNF